MKHEHIKTDEFKSKIEEGGYELIDMRTREEFESGHIEGAVNIDFQNESFAEMLESLDREKRYLLYCRTGNKSGQTLDLMKEKGFVEAYNMTGGIMEWNDEGYDVVK